jgi:hypothetical protein
MTWQSRRSTRSRVRLLPGQVASVRALKLQCITALSVGGVSPSSIVVYHTPGAGLGCIGVRPVLALLAWCQLRFVSPLSISIAHLVALMRDHGDLQLATINTLTCALADAGLAASVRALLLRVESYSPNTLYCRNRYTYVPSHRTVP